MQEWFNVTSLWVFMMVILMIYQQNFLFDLVKEELPLKLFEYSFIYYLTLIYNLLVAFFTLRLFYGAVQDHVSGPWQYILFIIFILAISGITLFVSMMERLLYHHAESFYLEESQLKLLHLLAVGIVTIFLASVLFFNLAIS